MKRIEFKNVVKINTRSRLRIKVPKSQKTCSCSLQQDHPDDNRMQKVNVVHGKQLIM